MASTDADSSQFVPPVTLPILPPDFPDVPQNPGSELQPPPGPSAKPSEVAGTTLAPFVNEAESGRHDA
jgi:hypothetical protein